MGKPCEPPPVKLLMSLITGEEACLHQALEALRERFGEIDFVSERLRFDFTHYYAQEMGENLFRHFITFKPLISRETLPDIKWSTNRLEERLADPNGRRRINIDPGYLCHAHMILATTKAYSHRPYLRRGIYADLTLLYRNQSFQPLEWTYPDYRQVEAIQLFNHLRKGYLEQIRSREGMDERC